MQFDRPVGVVGDERGEESQRTGRAVARDRFDGAERGGQHRDVRVLAPRHAQCFTRTVEILDREQRQTAQQRRMGSQFGGDARPRGGAQQFERSSVVAGIERGSRIAGRSRPGELGKPGRVERVVRQRHRREGVCVRELVHGATIPGSRDAGGSQQA